VLFDCDLSAVSCPETVSGEALQRQGKLPA